MWLWSHDWRVAQPVLTPPKCQEVRRQKLTYLSPLGPLDVFVCLDLHLEALAHNVLCSCVVPVLLSLPQAQAQANLHPSLDGLCNACSSREVFVKTSPVPHCSMVGVSGYFVYQI